MEPEGELNDKASDSKPVGLNRRPESEKVSEPTVCVCALFSLFLFYTVIIILVLLCLSGMITS